MISGSINYPPKKIGVEKTPFTPLKIMKKKGSKRPWGIICFAWKAQENSITYHQCIEEKLKTMPTKKKASNEDKDDPLDNGEN